MQILEFNRLIAKNEGKKKQVTIAQINEVIKVANNLTDGELYRIIYKLGEEKKPCLILSKLKLIFRRFI